jgi:hypothetical protein
MAKNAVKSYPPISKNDILEQQKMWGDAVIMVSNLYLANSSSTAFVEAASKGIDDLYGYDVFPNVFFKPTKACYDVNNQGPSSDIACPVDNEFPFRATHDVALSYFVGHGGIGWTIDGAIEDDHGFAINGGIGWDDVKFQNYQIDLDGDLAFANGIYTFHSVDNISNHGVIAEYTFGYKRDKHGKIRIFIHHSSLPYATPDGVNRRTAKA